MTCGFWTHGLLVTLRMILDYLRIVLSAVVLRCAGGNTFPIVGTGTFRISLRSGDGVVCATLMNIAHVPGLFHHLLSLRRIADAETNKSVTERASE